MAEPEIGTANAETAEAQQQGVTQTAEPVAAETAAPDARLAELERKAKAAAEEAIAERKKRQEAEARVAEFEAASLSDKEKAEKRAAEADARAKAAEDRARKLAGSMAITTAAQGLGFVDAEVASQLVDTSEWDFDGDVSAQAKAALESLAKAKPFLIGQAASSANGNTRPGTKMTLEDIRALTRDDFAKMSDAERDAVREVLRASG